MLLPILLVVLVQEAFIPFGQYQIFWAIGIGSLLLLTLRCYRAIFLITLLATAWLTTDNFTPVFKTHSARSVLVKLESNPQVHQVRDLQLKFQVIDPGVELKLPRSARIYCRSVSLIGNNADYLEAGGSYVIAGKFEQLEISAESNFDRSLLLQGFDAKCQLDYLAPLPSERSWVAQVKERIIQNSSINQFFDDATALFLSMSLGYEQALSGSQTQLFKGLGLAHLLVVSGFQVTLIFYFIRFIVLKTLLLSRRLASWFNLESLASCLAVVVSYYYARLVGFDSACTRAVIALCLLAITKILDRNVSFLNLICSTFLIDLIINPYCYRQPGSQLTYFALLGIALGHQAGSGFFVNLVRINFYTTISTGLISIVWFDNFYLISFFTNLIIAPIATVISCQLGFVALGLLYFDYKWFFDLCVFLIYYLNESLKIISYYFSENISSPLLLMTLVLLWLVICYYRLILYFRNSLFRSNILGF